MTGRTDGETNRTDRWVAGHGHRQMCIHTDVQKDGYKKDDMHAKQKCVFVHVHVPVCHSTKPVRSSLLLTNRTFAFFSARLSFFSDLALCAQEAFEAPVAGREEAFEAPVAGRPVSGLNRSSLGP